TGVAQPGARRGAHRGRLVFSARQLDHPEDVVVVPAPFLGGVDGARKCIRARCIAGSQGAGRCAEYQARLQKVPSLQLVDPDCVFAHVATAYLRLNSGAISTISQRPRSSPTWSHSFAVAGLTTPSRWTR